MGSIRLHPEKGLNPKIVRCSQCGKDTNELVLLGACNFRTVCPDCGLHLIGGGKCPRCHVLGGDRKELEDGSHITAGICDSCKKLNKACNEEVAAGGIHWKCEDCGSTGAIKAHHPLAKDVRAQMIKQKIIPPHVEGTPYPPCGVAFTKEPQRGLSCPVCGPDAVDLGGVNKGKGV